MLTSSKFIPTLIKHYREGHLPIDKLVKFYKVGSVLDAIACLLLIHTQIDDYKTALHDMHTGETIKPVILF